MSGDAIARLWADAWVAKHQRPETDAERAMRTEADAAAREAEAARLAAFDRALSALERGEEALRADIVLFRSNPDLHLDYLGAWDAAFAQHGPLSWALRRAHGERPLEGDGWE